MRKLLAIAVLALLPLCATLDTGCAGKGQLNPTTGTYDTNAPADPIVVNAQRVRAVALEVFDGFMKAEKENDAKWRAVNPAIHAAAEEIRRNGKTWLEDLTKATTAYQSNRTADGKSRLNRALAVVLSATSSAQEYLAKNL